MSDKRVLLVEDNLKWQKILQTHIRQALADLEVGIAADYEDGCRELQQQQWDLLVADLGLPPDTEHVLGMHLVHLAKDAQVPCIVVSGTLAVTKKHVRDLLRGEQYRAQDFFDKDDLQASPDRQREFQDLVRRLLTGDIGTTTPADAGPRRCQGNVLIDSPGAYYRLTAGGIDIPCSIRPDLNRLFGCFAYKVWATVPSEVVPSTVLNQAVAGSKGSGGGEMASRDLINAIRDLNAYLGKWALPPDGKAWIMNERRAGYYLNRSITTWSADKNLFSSSVHSNSVGKKIEETPDQRLPARPRSKPPDQQDDD